MTCVINNTEQEFSSVYLSAQAPERKKQLHTITKSKIFKEHAIIGGDFNCVENVDLDVRYPAEGGSTYANASGQTLARLIAESGLIDSYRLVHTVRERQNKNPERPKKSQWSGRRRAEGLCGSRQRALWCQDPALIQGGEVDTWSWPGVSTMSHP